MSANLPSDWNYESLGACCTIVSGATPRRNVPEYWGNDIPWVTPKDISNLDGSILEDAPEYISKAGYESCSATILPKGSVLFSSRAPIGLVALISREMCTNQGFKSLIPGDGVNSEYLYHCMKWMAPKIADLGNGATFKEVSKEVVSRVEIPLPPLPEQKRIGAILDKADAIGRKRQQAIKLAAEFLRATFLDMFGDPVINPKGWEVISLDSVCNKITDGTHDTPKRLETGITFITGKHIKPFFVDFENCDYVSSEDYKEIIKRCKPEKGDILYTNIGANVGTAAMNTWEDTFSMKNVALLKPNKKMILSRYLEYVLNHSGMKDKILGSNSVGGAQKFLSLTQIKRIKIPVPSLSAQNQLENILKNASDLIEKYKFSLSENDEFFNSLTQRAFRGEL